MAVITKNHTSIDAQCNYCKGKCWHPDDQSKTQQQALAMFGCIPNKCVNGEGEIVHCPAAKGLI